MSDAENPQLVLHDNLEGRAREGGWRRGSGGRGHMYAYGQFMLLYGKNHHVLTHSIQSRLTLCDPMDRSPPGFSVHGISRQEYWSGLPCPPPGDLPEPKDQSHIS